MKYTIDNKTIDLPDEFINDYKKYTGVEFSQTNFKAAYLRALESNPKDIVQEIVKQVNEELAFYKDPSILEKAFAKGIHH